jgi:uncharacterized protein affecting Mg2+/Co2+ transport
MKYSIVISNIQDDLYALVCRCWEIDAEGNQVDVDYLNMVNLTILQAQTYAVQFVENHG